VTPLLSWLLVITLGTLGAAFAIAVARWLDGADDRAWLRDMEQWKQMCAALELYDWDDPPTDVADEPPHRAS